MQIAKEVKTFYVDVQNNNFCVDIKCPQLSEMTKFQSATKDHIAQTAMYLEFAMQKTEGRKMFAHSSYFTSASFSTIQTQDTNKPQTRHIGRSSHGTVCMSLSEDDRERSLGR